MSDLREELQAALRALSSIALIQQDRQSSDTSKIDEAGGIARKAADSIRTALASSPVMTEREAVCIMAINTALRRIGRNEAERAVEPLTRARELFADGAAK